MSSYNDTNQSHLHYGIYSHRGTGHNHYPIGQHHAHHHHLIHRKFGGNSAHQHWDYPNTHSSANYLNQYGGGGYTTSLNTYHGSGSKRRKAIKGRRRVKRRIIRR